MKPDYGFDAPGVMLNVLLIAVGLLLLAQFLPVVHLGPVTFRLKYSALATASALLLEDLLMLIYVKVGKFQHRDRMLQMVDWKGNESMLDIGTGRGLLMIGAAKRLTTGLA